MKVVKRNGKIDDFQVFKVKKAIEKAFNATKTCFSEDMLDILSLRVTADFQEKIIHGKIDIEEIQNSVEKVLSDVGYSKVAKAYILYRKQREKLRDIKNILDYSKVVDSYINTEDWRVKENSTVTYSIGGLILHNSGAISANYWLSEIYDEEIANSHRNGDFHLHDLSMLTGYCAGWSLRELLS